MDNHLLGVYVGNKTINEWNSIVSALGLRDLSKDSYKQLSQFPNRIREHLVNNPSNAGKFTDERIKNILAPIFELRQSIASLHPVRYMEQQIGEIIANEVQRAADASNGDFGSDAFLNATILGTRDALNFTSDTTGYSSVDFSKISNLDLQSSNTYALMTLHFKDGTDVERFKFEKPQMLMRMNIGRDIHMSEQSKEEQKFEPKLSFEKSTTILPPRTYDERIKEPELENYPLRPKENEFGLSYSKVVEKTKTHVLNESLCPTKSIGTQGYSSMGL